MTLGQYLQGQLTSSMVKLIQIFFFRITCKCPTSLKLWKLISGKQFSGVATGGKRGNLPPPPPTSDRTPREIDADPRIFVSEKMRVGLQDLLRRFNACTDTTADVLWSHAYEKRGSWWSCWRSYSGRPSVKLRGPQGSFSPGIGPPKHYIFILLFIFILKCEFGAPPKK